MQPNSLAIASRDWSWGNPTTATSAPRILANAPQSNPIGPGPRTAMRSPGRMFALATTALNATQQGSVNAA